MRSDKDLLLRACMVLILQTIRGHCRQYVLHVTSFHAASSLVKMQDLAVVQLQLSLHTDI